MSACSCRTSAPTRLFSPCVNSRGGNYNTRDQTARSSVCRHSTTLHWLIRAANCYQHATEAIARCSTSCHRHQATAVAPMMQASDTRPVIAEQWRHRPHAVEEAAETIGISHSEPTATALDVFKGGFSALASLPTLSSPEGPSHPQSRIRSNNIHQSRIEAREMLLKQ